MIALSQKRLELKKKLATRQKVFGAWTSLGHPWITEIFIRSGVDFIGIDIEHSTISLEQAAQIIAAGQGNGALCLPRLASHNREVAKRLVDAGADGLIAPMVATAAEVDEIIAWVKYPPQGKRSFGISRGQGYGFDFDDYIKNWNDSSIFIAQIESIEGVENIESILSAPAIDGVMIGPYDISGSLDVPGQLDHPEVIKAADKVIKACAKSGKACGTQIVQPNETNIEQVFQAGYTFAVLASDIFVLWKWSALMRETIDWHRQQGKK